MAVEIRPVASKRDLKAFIKLPWRLYRNEPQWVPPLLMDVKRRFDRERNPFFGHAEAEFFLAWRDGRPVGRLTAHIDRNLNEYQDNAWGMFGFFECEEDQEAADALLGAAEAWLRERDRDRMLGPMDYTTNDWIGVLVEGHDRPPIILSSWHHAYYPKLLEGYGLAKAIDTLMWELHIEDRDSVHPGIWEVAAKVESEHGITVRPMRKRDLEAEVERFLEVYNAAWQRNWGFVPLTPEEVRHYASELKPILDENWAWLAFNREGETVAAALTLPDYNQVLAHLNGRLLPFGWAKALYWRRKIDRVFVFALGAKPEYRDTGVAAKLYENHFDSAERTPQTWGEMGWILEVNKPMNRAMEGMGGKIVRRYRVFEKVLDQG